MPHPIPQLTLAQREEVLSYLPSGGDRIAVCEFVGVTPLQLQLEMKRDPAFAESVARAEARVELTQMSKVLKATNDEKNWRTSVWWLERRSRQRQRMQHPHDEEALVELIDAVARALAEELSDHDQVRRIIERLFDIITQAGDLPAALLAPPKALTQEEP